MNWKLMLCVAMGVLVAHLGVFMMLSHINPRHYEKPPEPNFLVRSEVFVDRSSGEKTVYREITVSTRLATPPPAPAARPELVAPLPAVIEAKPL